MIFSASPIDGLRALLTIRLNDSNFRIWTFQFKTVLEGQDLFGYCDGTSVCPPKYLSIHDDQKLDEVTVEYKAWQKTDNALLRLLIATISNETIEYLVGSKTIREAWKRLHDRYDREPSIQPPKPRSAALNGENRVSSSLTPMSALSTAATIPGYGQYLLLVQNVLTAHQAFLSTVYGSKFRTIEVEQISEQANKEKIGSSNLENTETQTDDKSHTEDVPNSPHEASLQKHQRRNLREKVIQKGKKATNGTSDSDLKPSRSSGKKRGSAGISNENKSPVVALCDTEIENESYGEVTTNFNEVGMDVDIEDMEVAELNKKTFVDCIDYSMVLADHLHWKIKHIAQPPGF